MRAVSFFGLGAVDAVAVGTGGAGGGAVVGGFGTEAGAGMTPLLPTAGAGGGGDKGGGSTRLAGGGGKGVCAMGGRGGAAGESGPVGGGGAPFGCRRVGKLIRTVSGSPLLAGGGWSGGRGGKVMRTVSFLGSLGSAISPRKLG